MKRLIIWVSVAALLLAIAIVIPNVLPPRTVSSRNACVANLELIQRKKDEWSRRSHHALSEIPSETDLFVPNGFPACPAGGSYIIGALNQKPTCSIGSPVHSLSAK